MTPERIAELRETADLAPKYDLFECLDEIERLRAALEAADTVIGFGDRHEGAPMNRVARRLALDNYLAARRALEGK